MVSFINITDHLRHHAKEYFADVRGEPDRVELQRTRRRINSTLHEFIISDGTTEYMILVKSPTPPKPGARGDSAGRDHPRLFPKVQREVKSRFEFQTMSAIEQHVARLGDPRFGAVRVFDLMPDGQSLVMEKVSERSLSELLRKPSLIAPAGESRQAFDCTVRNAGSWLRRYHALESLGHTQCRGASRADFIASISQFTRHAGEVGERAYYEWLGRELKEVAETILPTALPLGLSHGDYTPSNILAGPSGRIRIIDTLGRWRAPIYEDISRFLMTFKASAPQVRRLGAHRSQSLVKLEHQFLAGYFEHEPIPLGCIRLFECQALVERAAAFAYRYRESRGWKRIIKGGRAAWWNGFLRRTAGRLLADARPAPGATHEHVKEVSL